MTNTDHVALTLSSTSVTGLSGGAAGDESNISRRSLRRSWNQLPRCQRNLIIMALTAFIFTALLFLPGDQLINIKDVRLKPGAAPFHIRRENTLQNPHHHPNVEKGNELPGDISAAVASPMTDENRLIKAKPAEEKMDDSKFAENVDKLPETVLVGNENGIIDIVNNVDQPIEEPLDNNINDHSNLRAEVEEAIRNPFKVSHVSIESHLQSMSAQLAKPQHFHGATNERQSAVVAAFKHSWAGYKTYAWGHDNLKPVSQTSHEWFGLGLSIVDSLDTMYIMGLEDEFNEARDWVKDSLHFHTNRDVNLFEVTIRVLGGLLSAYHLSGDRMFLVKATELGNRLLPSFLSPSGIPYSDVNLGERSAHSPKWSPDSSTSEVTTIQLEFRDLSRSTNVSIYERVVNVVNEKVHALDKSHGLVPIFINANTGTFRNYATISLGARGDSYYEYLLKQWLQTGRKDNDNLILDYMQAIDGVFTQLMRRTPREHWVYIGELINGHDFKPKMDHLTCYLPGTLLLGHQNGMPESHLLLAKDLLDTCYQTYVRQPTQLAAEISYFALTDKEENDIYVKSNDAHNLLRPEFIESLYYFYALTGNRTYQDMGWVIFQAFEKHSKVAAGYTSLGNVKNTLNTRMRDLMESFWLSETLKYFYLLFSDNCKEIDLDKWVFNSEGHPLPVYQN
ncbi:endoplasmic reticulum mannosyl-oligosaccharide 1,2-alpha-mannosidase [Drosophila navojoa]|uniref:endoplasmic reticulum mannosyl-oligosaccharide 1,2-alpha-mannosidase n=1 Tax=Drosophila navojoa TaxID=7232 RepID=UPI000847C6A4|nr:endoplasmic reticulum mannosyl-oligosaccharide 1,2-alpha-mannosidase [Drosophila navojoa]